MALAAQVMILGAEKQVAALHEMDEIAYEFKKRRLQERTQTDHMYHK